MAHATPRFVRFNEFATVFDGAKTYKTPSENDSDEGVSSMDGYDNEYVIMECSHDYVNMTELNVNNNNVNYYTCRERESVIDKHVTSFSQREKQFISKINIDNSGTPFDVVCQQAEGAKAAEVIYARGAGLTQAEVGEEVYVEVDTSTYPDLSLTAVLTDVSGREVDTVVSDEDEDQFRIGYTPTVPGAHTLSILYSGQHIQGSPYTVHVTQPTCNVVVHDLNTVAYLGHKSTFIIDASKMKKGTLEIDSDLPILAYDKLGQNIYKVTFVPKKKGSHDMVIKYNNMEVNGCPFVIEVVKAKR